MAGGDAPGLERCSRSREECPESRGCPRSGQGVLQVEGALDGEGLPGRAKTSVLRCPRGHLPPAPASVLWQPSTQLCASAVGRGAHSLNWCSFDLVSPKAVGACWGFSVRV